MKRLQHEDRTIGTVGGSRATLGKQPAQIAAMFDRVARRYDLVNTVMTGGMDRLWRSAARRALDCRSTERVLDLAAGTGVSTAELARPGAYVVGCDFAIEMLRAGRHRGVPMVAGDALALPFTDGSFDAVTISFGLRNVVDVDAVLRELWRITRPGGRLVVCEVSHPPLRALSAAYDLYMRRVMPTIASVVASNPTAYRYLSESAAAWPRQSELAGMITGAGWADVRWHNLTGGVVALHHAARPA